MNFEIHYSKFSPEQGNSPDLGHTNHFFARARKSDQTGTLREPFFARSRTIQPFSPELGKVTKEALQEIHFFTRARESDQTGTLVFLGISYIRSILYTHCSA